MRLASIDAFWDLAALDPPSRPALRHSLRRLAPPAAVTPDQRAIDQVARRQDALILVGVALLHVLMLLGLRALMQPPRHVNTREVTPLQVTFIETRPALVLPKPIVAPPVVPQPRVMATPQQFVPRTDALQSVAIPPATVPMPAVAQPPAAPLAAPPRDLLAHRSVDWMLPGGAKKNSPDFQVRDDPSPQNAVNTVARVASVLIGNVAARPDQNGIVLSAPDRGVRTSGRDSDPCDDIAIDIVDVNASAKEREQAGDRYERNCQGH